MSVILRRPPVHDALLGKIPIFSGWTVDPTDSANLTDGDITTAMTTGNKVLSGGWQRAYIDFSLPSGWYHVTLLGRVICAASTGYMHLFGDAIQVRSTFGDEANLFCHGSAYVTDQLRLSLTASGASTVSPSLYRLSAFRMGD